jgi:hypothetical protein
MLDTLTDHDAPAAAAPASANVLARETLVLFAPNDALEKLLPAHSARRFAALRSSLREASARSGPRRPEPQHRSLGGATAALREATKCYERHVLAWYALGRVAEARSARAAIVQHQLRRRGKPDALVSCEQGSRAPRCGTDQILESVRLPDQLQR